ncbi:PREDICTED: venom serine protease Bi-VSP-like isoform X2 [Dinoponera quadriceps]|uniref:Venom serine protease Bi-VSP-like isoform X2 n=1 Tax=Dinoponera quadriceps TaxID=609295 RepID=A0A6P3XHZ3_DINQU|nr:PREDICTED: venom serine protease Bi-VSP-like isoform X2 [Dinoponera quadriceps]
MRRRRSVHHPVQTMLVRVRDIERRGASARKDDGSRGESLTGILRSFDVGFPLARESSVPESVDVERTSPTHPPAANPRSRLSRFASPRKMYCLLSLLLLPIATASQLCEPPEYQFYYMCPNNTLSCPDDKRCAFVEHCPAIASLMGQNELPVHRLRQAVCGYDQTRVKICCDTADYFGRPSYANSDLYPTQPSPNSQCGKSLIWNNEDALGAYPFVARIGFINMLTGEMKYSCSGVIVSERTVLTTATCALAKSERYKLCSVLIGEYNTESDPDCNGLFCGRKTSSHDISYVIKHPGHDAATFSNNVALLRLKKTIDFTATAQPICFIPEDRYVSLGSTCTVVGWGRLSGQKEQPTTQQSLQLKLVPKQQCSDYLSQSLSVELCATGSCEPCSGYSGSPMLYKYADTYFLVGILSYGSSCDSTTVFPSAFVNVQRYTRWILENY